MRREADVVLLPDQLLLLEEKKREVPEFLRRGGRPGQDVADELVGIRMVILAALLQGAVGPGAERDELRLREREAPELLREVLPRRERPTPGHAGDPAGGQVAVS